MEEKDFDVPTCSRIMRKLEIRAMLLAILSETIAVVLLLKSNSNFLAEVSFVTFSLITFSILGIAMLYKIRHRYGNFGTRQGDTKLIFAWLREENHWWGKPLF